MTKVIEKVLLSTLQSRSLVHYTECIKETLLFLGGIGAMAALFINREVFVQTLVNELKMTFLTDQVQVALFAILLLMIVGSYATKLAHLS